MKQVYEVDVWITNTGDLRPEMLTENDFSGWVPSSRRVDFSDMGWTKLGPARVELELDLNGLNQRQVEALQAEKRNVMAEAEVKLNRIEEKIQRLLCLPLEVS